VTTWAEEALAHDDSASHGPSQIRTAVDALLDAEIQNAFVAGRHAERIVRVEAASRAQQVVDDSERVWSSLCTTTPHLSPEFTGRVRVTATMDR
jgi:hypothetical protein